MTNFRVQRDRWGNFAGGGGAVFGKFPGEIHLGVFIVKLDCKKFEFWFGQVK